MKIGMISIYPPPDYTHHGTSGVASYTKNLVTNFPKDCKVIVFANKFDNSKDDKIYIEDNVKVIYCWNKNFLFPFKIFLNVLKNRREIDIVHIQHEFFIYGGKSSYILFIFMLLLLKTLNKPFVVTLHHGFLKPSNINRRTLKELNINIRPTLFRFGLKMFFKAVSHLSSLIIVHESLFRDILINHYGVNNRKIGVIPHGIENSPKKIDHKEAKKLLNLEGKKIILYFGYISKFKGVDVLIDCFSNLKDDEHVLIIAGGKHPRLEGDPEYEKFVKNIKENSFKNVIFTGFISDCDIPLYFSAADLVTLPYKLIFASSGPLSLAIAYEKPFLVSKAFKEIIGVNEVIFENSKEFIERVNMILNNGPLKYKLLKYIKMLKNQRRWSRICINHLKLYKNIFGDD